MKNMIQLFLTFVYFNIRTFLFFFTMVKVLRFVKLKKSVLSIVNDAFKIAEDR